MSLWTTLRSAIAVTTEGDDTGGICVLAGAGISRVKLLARMEVQSTCPRHGSAPPYPMLGVAPAHIRTGNLAAACPTMLPALDA